MANLLKKNNPIFKPIHLFNDLTNMEREALLTQSKKVYFKKNAMIFEQEQPGDVMFFIEEGQVKLARVDLSGKELILSIMGPGDFFGEMAVMNNCGRSASAFALTDLKLLSISRSDFNKLLANFPQFAIRIISILCARLQIIDERLEEIAFGSTKERLKSLLYKDYSARKVQLEQTHQELAAKVGASRETVTRVLKSLKEEGWQIVKRNKK